MFSHLKKKLLFSHFLNIMLWNVRKWRERVPNRFNWHFLMLKKKLEVNRKKNRWDLIDQNFRDFDFFDRPKFSNHKGKFWYLEILRKKTEIPKSRWLFDVNSTLFWIVRSNPNSRSCYGIHLVSYFEKIIWIGVCSFFPPKHFFLSFVFSQLLGDFKIDCS